MQRSLGLTLIASLYQLRLGCIHFFISVFWVCSHLGISLIPYNIWLQYKHENWMRRIHVIGKHYSNWLRLLGVFYLFIKTVFFSFLLELYSRVKLILCGLTLRGQWTFTVSRVHTIALTWYIYYLFKIKFQQ